MLYQLCQQVLTEWIHKCIENLFRCRYDSRWSNCSLSLFQSHITNNCWTLQYFSIIDSCSCLRRELLNVFSGSFSPGRSALRYGQCNRIDGWYLICKTTPRPPGAAAHHNKADVWQPELPATTSPSPTGAGRGLVHERPRWATCFQYFCPVKIDG